MWCICVKWDKQIVNRKWFITVQRQLMSNPGKVIKSLIWVMLVMSPSVRDTWLFYRRKSRQIATSVITCNSFSVKLMSLKFTQAPFKVCYLNEQTHGCLNKWKQSLPVVQNYDGNQEGHCVTDHLTFFYRNRPHFTRACVPFVFKWIVWVWHSSKWHLPCCYIIWLQERALFNFKIPLKVSNWALTTWLTHLQ